MKKKILLVVVSILVTFCFIVIHPQKVEAIYGNQGQYTTQRALRGTWYYRDLDHSGKHYRIYRLKITAHKIGHYHLYRRNSKPVNDFTKWNSKKQKQAMRVTKYWLSCTSFRYKGQNVLNTMGWFQSAGDGTYYILTKKYVGGKYVKAIRVAGGAYLTTIYWAVKSRNLARKIHISTWTY